MHCFFFLYWSCAFTKTKGEKAKSLRLGFLSPFENVVSVTLLCRNSKQAYQSISSMQACGSGAVSFTFTFILVFLKTSIVSNYSTRWQSSFKTQVKSSSRQCFVLVIDVHLQMHSLSF